MAKYSMKKGGKEVGPASTYAEPHTMTGKKVTGMQPEKSGKQVIDELNPSSGFVSKGNTKPVKTSGIKIRGTGAATKGVMARGPMA
jgi:hypothetical protein